MVHVFLTLGGSPIKRPLHEWVSFVERRDLNPTREKTQCDTKNGIEPGPPVAEPNALPTKPLPIESYPLIAHNCITQIVNGLRDETIFHTRNH